MTRRRRAAAAAASLILAAGAAAVIAAGPDHHHPVRTRPTTVSPPRSLSITCRSPALGGALPTIVYLPAGYDSGSDRLRVIYFLHGLPAARSSYTENAFVANAVASGARRAIVVAPQGARADGDDPEYLDWGPTENWPQAISHDLTRCIDSRFRTIPGRAGRALVGLSAGGYGAFDIGLRNLDTFGAVESWSGYFAATDPTGLRELDFGSAEANDLARVREGPSLAAALASRPTFIGFYVGRQDRLFLKPNLAFDATLALQGIAHLFRSYAGGHSASLWRAQAHDWLGYALSALAAGR